MWYKIQRNTGQSAKFFQLKKLQIRIQCSRDGCGERVSRNQGVKGIFTVSEGTNHDAISICNEVFGWM